MNAQRSVDTARFLFFQHVSELGGSSWSLAQMIDGLKLRPEQTHVALREEGALADWFRARGIAVHIDHRIQPLWHAGDLRSTILHPRSLQGLTRMRSSMDAARDLCARIAPDLVHINSAVLLPLASGVRAAGKVAVVLHLREHWETGHGDPRRAIQRRIVGADVDHVVAITESGAERFGFQEKTTVVHNWPDFTGRNGSLSRAVLGLPANCRLVVDLGGRNSIKGALVSVRAMKHVTDAAACLVVVGGARTPGGAFKRAARFALQRTPWKTYGLRLETEAARQPGRIVLTAPVLQMEELFRMAEVLLCPFSEPHFSKAAIEAGSLGKPVIMADGPEARDAVIDGETGLLVPRGDAPALARALNRLLDDKGLARSMGERAREHVARKYSRDESLRRLRSVYENVLG